jgi:glycosyltransferase involved in cell wall biosynthesis
MLSILINAYACSPNMGSEPGMAWNWCINLAHYCELHIITEGEFRDTIEAVLPTLPQGKNMHFYYNPVSEKIRKMCWNQGDWRFYSHYKKWQYKTYQIASEIVKKEKIDILHQLNMIGFREPGYLWKIPNIPFIWGPVGGLKQFPTTYLKCAGWKMNLFNRIKNFINVIQIKYDRRVKQALLKANLLISSIPDSYEMIKRYQGLESVLIPETGCYIQKDIICSNRFSHERFDILWVGKFDFRKQLEIALYAIAKIKALKGVKLYIYGTGADAQIQMYQQLANSLYIEKQIEWCGSVANQEILRKMQNAQLFFFTSVSEDTSTVVLEALSCCLPVLCFDTCGFGTIVNESIGIKIPLSNPDQSIREFAEKIEYLYHNRDILKTMSQNCIERQKELSWDNKARQMVALYYQVIENQEKKVNKSNIIA